MNSNNPSGTPLRALKDIGKASNLLRDAFDQVYLMIGNVGDGSLLPQGDETDQFLLHAKDELRAMLEATQELERDLSKRLYSHAYQQDALALKANRKQLMPVSITPQLPEFL